MTSTTVHVQLLGPAEAHRAGPLLTASHGAYPSFIHLYPDAATRARALRPFMAAAARDAARFGRCYAATDEEGVLGIALWMPPGTFPLSAARKARMTPALLRVALASPRAFPAFARSGAALERAHPEGPSWYLQALGVHPRAQRRGVGGKLMAPVLDEADAAGAACTLHTSDPANIAYYQRFGFEVTQPDLRVSAEGPAYIGMWRSPR
jgi:ribosomal protein S18 acetylase RimI-like enzyme